MTKRKPKLPEPPPFDPDALVVPTREEARERIRRAVKAELRRMLLKKDKELFALARSLRESQKRARKLAQPAAQLAPGFRYMPPPVVSRSYVTIKTKNLPTREPWPKFYVTVANSGLHSFSECRQGLAPGRWVSPVIKALTPAAGGMGLDKLNCGTKWPPGVKDPDE